MKRFNIKNIIKSTLNNVAVKNIVLVGIISLGVRALGFLKDIIIADNFGLSEILDTFYIAILIPGLISGIFLGSFQSVFIPNYIGELKNGKNAGAFQSACFLITIGVALFFLLIAMLFTDVYLDVFFPGHSENYYALIKTQFYYVAPCILFWGFSSLLSGLLTIDDEFTYSSINSVFTPISIIICVLFFRDELGIIVLAFGTLIGSILNFLFLLIIVIKRKIIALKTPDFKSRNIVVLFKQLPAKLSSSLLSGVNPLVDQYFAAQLVVGSISALSFGAKIPMFAIGIVGIALGKVLLPYFSKNAIDDKVKTFKRLNQILRKLIVPILIIMLVLILLSKPIITLFFERNAFTSDDTIVVSKIMQMYLLQIPSYISGLIMVKFLTAINKNNFMVLTSVMSLVLNIVLNLILIEKIGVYGLALATSLVSIINSVVLYVYIRNLNKMYV